MAKNILLIHKYSHKITQMLHLGEQLNKLNILSVLYGKFIFIVENCTREKFVLKVYSNLWRKICFSNYFNFSYLPSSHIFFIIS